METIISTKDYSGFSFLPCNRAVSKAHVRRLKISIQDQNLDIPIIVNEKMQIIDGQHRFEALKKLGFPINYIIRKGLGIKEVKILNSQQKNWKLSDYVLSYVEEGFSDYCILKKFKDQYGLTWVTSARLLSGDLMYLYDSIRNGAFKVKNEDEAKLNAGILKRILTHIIMGRSGFAFESFITAMLDCMRIDGFNVEQFITRLKRYPKRGSINAFTRIPDFIAEIENIYNWHSQEKQCLPIRFLWEQRIKKERPHHHYRK